MTTPHFVVPLADLEDGPRRVRWGITTDWLRRALEGTEATPKEDGWIEVELSLNGREVMVRGKAEVQLTMPCAVTLDPTDVEVRPDVFLLLSPAGSGPGGPRRGPARTGGPAASPGGRGKERGKSRPAERTHSEGRHDWTADPVLSPEDAGRDVYSGKEIVLDHFVREFILLELPMTPRRSSLPSTAVEATPLRPAEPGAHGEAPIDPRLAPLADIANRMRPAKKE